MKKTTQAFSQHSKMPVSKHHWLHQPHPASVSNQPPPFTLKRNLFLFFYLCLRGKLGGPLEKAAWHAV